MVKAEFSIVQDTQEKKPRLFPDRDVVIKKLKTGDYSIEGFEDRISIETKAVGDIIGTCDFKNRDRFKRELERAMDFDFFAILIDGTEEDVRDACAKLYKRQFGQWTAKARRGIKCRKPMRPEVRFAGIIGSLKSWRSTFNAHFYFTGSPQKTSEWIDEAFSYYVKSRDK